MGAPNSGKSTLLNCLVGSKVSIVTHKSQTTRTRISGVTQLGDVQLIFYDTPGIFYPKRQLEKAMVSTAWSVAYDADILAVMVDSRKLPFDIDDDTEKILHKLNNVSKDITLIINKIDLVSRKSLLALTNYLTTNYNIFSNVFMISALTGDGVEDLKSHFSKLAPYGPWLYPEDQLTNLTERFLAQEITREKLFLALHDELPYSMMVEHVNWEDRKDGSVRIDQNILVSRDSQKPIVVGKGGALIRKIGSNARAELETVFGRTVHLFLNVIVRKKWLDDSSRYADMGLDYPKEN